jgi:hypothetical protein
VCYNTYDVIKDCPCKGQTGFIKNYPDCKTKHVYGPDHDEATKAGGDFNVIEAQLLAYAVNEYTWDKDVETMQCFFDRTVDARVDEGWCTYFTINAETCSGDD